MPVGRADAGAAVDDRAAGPMRWAQLTWPKTTPAKYDLHFWLDYFERTHSDAACLSAGGCVAFYPTKIPLHYRSQWMKQHRPVRRLVAGCRKMNMVVLARTDPHAVHQDVYDAHPDWIAVDAEGKKRRTGPCRDWWVTCALGPYNFEFMTEVTREIVSHVPGGRHFQQPLGGLRHVLLRALPAEFQTASGLDLPRSARSAEPRPPRLHRMEAAASVRALRSVGRPSAKSIPTPRSFPTPAAARSANST
jgi:hypothetical protein